MPTLAEAEWLAHRDAFQARIAPLVGPHVARQGRQQKHPVYDFLFQYYSFPTKRLQHWHPGFGLALQGDAAQEFLRDDAYVQTADGVTLSAAGFPAHRRAALAWIVDLLEKTTVRTPRFGCYGLHEWAMVYRIDHVRHGQLPLRMGAAELAAFVETQSICCSHYDAFRFFTPAARPLNAVQPTKLAQPELDQSGCVHVNMDLYKWSYKFFPWIGSDLIAECLLFAAQARELDMRASPYDCRSLGLDPIPIETPAGRAEYVRCQRLLSDQSVPLRARLLADYRALTAAVEHVFARASGPGAVGAHP